MEVMALVSQGYRNKEIGTKLFLSERTVKYYISKAFKKLKVTKRGNIIIDIDSTFG
jgi:LuxR family maltose regulon positive regulatory protein